MPTRDRARVLVTGATGYIGGRLPLDDVLRYPVDCLTVPEARGRTLEIGGRDSREAGS
ncbi:MAG TPA: hypothetical protein VLK28_10950 [Methylomirabilota bacterium]|nr:hypothetical protein [Methylomirabilota bacterium]